MLILLITQTILDRGDQITQLLFYQGMLLSKRFPVALRNWLYINNNKKKMTADQIRPDSRRNKRMPWLRKSQRFYCVLWLGNCHREQ